MKNKTMKRYILVMLLAFALLIAALLLPGLIGALLAFVAAALALGALWAMILEDKQYRAQRRAAPTEPTSRDAGGE